MGFIIEFFHVIKEKCRARGAVSLIAIAMKISGQQWQATERYVSFLFTSERKTVLFILEAFEEYGNI
jgi:hypothetical protein